MDFEPDDGNTLEERLDSIESNVAELEEEVAKLKKLITDKIQKDEELDKKLYDQMEENEARARADKNG